ncbi:MAG TPA: hypothetical protein VFJ45_10610 [bacterium]|nr:hypothetical protein [bacterium]
MADHGLAVSSAPVAEGLPLQPPLTERILARLGRPRWIWIALWVTGYQLSIIVAQAQTGLRIFPPGEDLRFYAAWGFLALVGLSAIRTVFRDVAGLQPLLDELIPPGEKAGANLFRGLDSTWGPLTIALLNAMLFSLPEFLKSPAPATAVLVLANFVSGIPAITFLWMYVVLLLALNRLGTVGLTLRPFQIDRSLGLARFGALAFKVFVLLAAGSIPMAFFGTPDLRTVVVNIGILVGASALLFVSLHRMHRQVVTAKAAYVAQARRLYAEAYASLGTPVSLHALTAQAASLNAAEALERRASTIQEWPLDEGLIARLAAIVTSLTAAILARFLLSRVGL